MSGAVATPGVAAAAAASPVLEVRGLSKTFPGTVALDGVDLDLRLGEVHTLLGENGAGKSTLIRCVCGAHAPSAGEIRVGGRSVRLASPSDAQRAGIAVVHQYLNLVPTLSVAENVWLGETLPRRLGLVDWRAVHARAREVLGRIGLDLPTDAPVSALRADQLALVAIARAVAGRARLIVLDEPTAALLPHEVETLFGRMRALAAEGHAFLYVSHRLAEVFEIADRVTVLRDGRVSGRFERAGLDRRAVIEAIVGRRESERVRRAASAGEEIVLEAEGLVGTRARGVSFALRRGEVLGVAGLPGSGAEETLALVYGAARRRAGAIRVAGREWRLRSPADAIAAGIALVPQDRLADAVFHADTVRANLTLPSLGRYLREPVLRLVDRRAEARGAEDAVRRMRVRTPGIEASIDELSGGNQQKVVLGRWLSTGARVFLLDSPTAAVDVGAKSEIHRLIGELATGGAGIVFSSTELEEYAMVCDRILVFSEGRVAAELPGDAPEDEIMTLAAGGGLHDRA